jgi:hypothetical protein
MIYIYISKKITSHGVNVFQKYIHPYHASVSVNPIIHTTWNLIKLMHKECKCFITYKVLHGIHMIIPDFIYVNTLAKWVYSLYVMFVHASNQGFFSPQFCQVT